MKVSESQTSYGTHQKIWPMKWWLWHMADCWKDFCHIDDLLALMEGGSFLHDHCSVVSITALRSYLTIWFKKTTLFSLIITYECFKEIRKIYFFLFWIFAVLFLILQFFRIVVLNALLCQKHNSSRGISDNPTQECITDGNQNSKSSKET